MLDLKKGQTLNLKKANVLDGVISVGCGWDIVGGKEFDLDLSCFGISNGKASERNLVFFNQKNLPGITHSGDNRTGAGDGDDEVIKVELDKVDPSITELRFTVNIFNAGSNTFADVQNEYVRLLDKTGKPVAKYEVGETKGSTVHFASLKRGADGWEFEPIGESMPATDLNGVLSAWS